MLTSFTGTRTARHAMEISSSAMLVCGRFSITDASVCGYREEVKRTEEKNQNPTCQGFHKLN